MYERAVAPLYFRSLEGVGAEKRDGGVENVATFFERGGQQYLYAEDVLTLDEGLLMVADTNGAGGEGREGREG